MFSNTQMMGLDFGFRREGLSVRPFEHFLHSSSTYTRYFEVRRESWVREDVEQRSLS